VNYYVHHEQEIVDRIVQQLNSQSLLMPALTQPILSDGRSLPPPSGTQPPSANPTLMKIAEQESQLATLRAPEERQDQLAQPGALGTFNPIQSMIPLTDESASRVLDSVEIMFPAVERATLVQIIENKFKPTNIHRLLGSEKDRVETHRTINIGGVEFKKAEREGRQSEYRMSSFFKAWGVYSGILIKLAPYILQGDLATSLCIYTMNLDDLLEKYTYQGVKSYHFQFHRMRLASGKSIYHPSDWRQLESELVASKGFAHPVPRPPWIRTAKPAPSQQRRTFELPLRDPAPGKAYSNLSLTGNTTYPNTERRSNYYQAVATPTTPLPPSGGFQHHTAPVCRNRNFRDCRATQCRYQHSCITCSGNHQATQCLAGNNRTLLSSRTGPHGR